MRTVADVIAGTGRPPAPLPAPEYRPHALEPRAAGHAVGLCVPSMRKHMTDEGWQLFQGLRAGGYLLAGFGAGTGLVDLNCTRGPDIVRALPGLDTVLVQDKREWVGRTAGPGFDHRERFTGVSAFRDLADLFRGTVLKDAHSDHPLHVDAAEELGAHFWVVYYDPDLVAAQAPFARRGHLVRTWHSLDADAVPVFDHPFRRERGILSGAVSRAYPMRARLALEASMGRLRNIDLYRHPGYGRVRCHTPDYLGTLSQYRVAVCTSSRFGYAVRKIAEATACGCVVVTDLPADDVLPEIDGNLVRVDPDLSPGRVDGLVGDLAAWWDADRQRVWADRAKRFYDYRAVGRKLAADIEALRRTYR